MIGTVLPAIALSAWGFSSVAGSSPDHPAIYLSAWWTMIVGFSAVRLFQQDDPDSFTDGRWSWAAGSGYQLLHVAIAFHLAHGWSHAAAFAHTKRIGGFGEGVYVNYFFTGVWLLDAMWVCLAPRSYQKRPRWVTWAVHGFMLFIVFNAMVVFGSWVARALFALFTCLLVREVRAHRFASRLNGVTV